MKTLFRYPGGKTKLMKLISHHLKPYHASTVEYREPFFGAGSVGCDFLSKAKTSLVFLNDKDPGIACVWTAVLKHPKELKDRIRSYTPAVNVYEAQKKALTLLTTLPECPHDIVNIAFQKLAIHQTSYSGLGTMAGSPLGGKEQKSKYKIDCRWSPDRLCEKIDVLHKLLSSHHVTIANLDFEEVITCGENALLYLDPPYYQKGNDLYQCGFTEEDHRRLATSLQQCKHSWLLSYDDCPHIREMYSWASIEETAVKYSITATGSSGSKQATTKRELLIYPTRESRLS